MYGGGSEWAIKLEEQGISKKGSRKELCEEKMGLVREK